MATLLIHTGGTIGMAQTSDGFAPRDGVVEDAVAALVASGKIAGEVEVLRLDPLVDSALATAQDWARIAPVTITGCARPGSARHRAAAV